MRSRKGMKRDMLKGVRPIGITMSFSEEEAEIVHDAADKDKSSLQYWARTRLLAAAEAEKYLEKDATDVHGHWMRIQAIEFLEAENNENQDSVPVTNA